MKLLILGLNYSPEPIGISVYTAGLAGALVSAGHEVRVVAGQPYYPAWRIMPGHSAWQFRTRIEGGVRVTRVPHYIPRNPTGLRRLFHHFSFAFAALFPMLWAGLFWRPQLVLAIAPSLIASPVAKLSALLASAPTWLHVQDFEVEAAFATGLLGDQNGAAMIARRFEAAILRTFGRVSAISPEMCEKLAEKGVLRERILEFRNWADVDAVRPMSSPSSYREAWRIATEHVALYSGNIANKQGIEIVLSAARMLEHREDLTFVVCGEGPNRRRLEEMATGLGNIQFHDVQPVEKLNDLMGLATIHLLPQLPGAADLVLPSKLTNMLASGRPVVATARMGTGLAREIDGCGVVIEPGDAALFAGAIEQLVSNKALWSASAAQARKRAEEYWAKDVVLGRILKGLELSGVSSDVSAASSNSVAEP